VFCLQTAYILPQYCKEEEFEDTKGIIRICKSKKERHHNGPILIIRMVSSNSSSLQYCGRMYAVCIQNTYIHPRF
jgi:hypothetical protein